MWGKWLWWRSQDWCLKYCHSHLSNVRRASVNVCLCTVHSVFVQLLLILLEVSLSFLRPWSVGWWRLETGTETHPRRWHLPEVEEGALYRLILDLCLQDKVVAQESRQKRLFHHCKQATLKFFSQYTVKSALCICVCVCVSVYLCVCV